MKRARRLGASLVAAGLMATFVVAACDGSGRRAPGRLTGVGVSTGGAQSGSGSFGDPEPDDCVEEGLCGNEVHMLSFDVPNVYFILDRSGSMAEPVEEGGDSRYKLVRGAMLGMVQSLGSLINVGAALFPNGKSDTDACKAGAQVFAVKPGDPITGSEGATTSALRQATNVTPKGGTPVSATLEALETKLSILEGRTIALLLTDGGPNCNAEAACGIDECMPAMEGFCALNDNCCEEGAMEFGPTFCVDRSATVKAVEALHSAGIDVYVIGIPGSEYYGSVLDEMALAGGVPQSGETKYHRVDDIDALEQLFAGIAADAISCEFVLQDPPPTEDETNVYLDCDVLPLDPANGWTWKDEQTVVLNGSACVDLKTGKVSQVQIVTGCPTETPK
jgi:hypothetical protein